MAQIFGTKHDIDNRPRALATWKSLLHRLKTTWTLVHKQLQIGPSFLPAIQTFCVLFIARLHRQEISKRNSTKLCHMVGVLHPTIIWGPQTAGLFLTTSQLNWSPAKNAI